MAPVANHGGMGMGSARALPGAPLPEEELWQGNPSAKALLGAILGTSLVVVLVPLAVYFGYPLVLGLLGGLSPDLARGIARHRTTIATAVELAVVVVVGVRVLRFAWRLAVLKSNHYRVTNQRILVESGVFSKRIEEIDMRLVDDFQLRQSFLERLLGIGDITILSSDRTAAQLVLLGLSSPRELRELIRSSAYGATRGQLFTRET
jgi:membrane protein YdbS with pleckstrin-like domain